MKELTVNELIIYLENSVKEDKKVGNYIAVTASDEEGNSFSPIYFAPTIGNFDGEDLPQFQATMPKELPEGYDEEDFLPAEEANAVCIN